MVGEMIFRTS